ncbi:alpha/beta hydrolase [Vibrio neptunius]|uniref:alpha/beta hydrolase n=1 Tax=Vibrio neptunius TaxID=170651 RepID=UPI0019D2DF1E|nr:dienelactone hydrolase family protein [Vibrio neptunius]MBN3574527.1 dienelactone hydrolase family protein [Vibrio neptunius]QXX05823.1 dienelactone hydrolase family protein [Vibrio neptunius]
MTIVLPLQTDIHPYTLSTAGAPLSDDNPVVILLHGRRQTEDDMANLIDKLALTEATYYLPSAPETTWYPRGFTRDLNDNQPLLDQGLEVIDQILQAILSQGVKRQRIWIIGFSQGACMAAEFVRRALQPLGGAIVYTGGLFGPECPVASAPKPVFEGMPMLLSGSHTDTWVPAERVTQTATYFGQLGAQVHLEIASERAHHVSQAEIELARGLITACYAPADEEVAHV